MKLLRRTIPLLVVIALGACSNGKVPLAYSFEAEDGTRYRWTIDSRTSANSSGDRSVTSLNMVIDVHEQVSGTRDGETPILTIELTPRTLRQGGSALSPPEPLTVRYELNDRGEIVKALTDDLAPQAASALQLGATLIRSRVALPTDPVGIGDEWDAGLVLDGDLGNIALDGTGKLLGFDLKHKRKLARIETKRSGEIITHEQQGGVAVRLRGTSSSDAISNLDLDSGRLHSSTARFISEFDISSLESGKLLGTMLVDLESRLDLQTGPAPRTRDS